MSRAHTRSAGAELVRLAGNVIYLSFLLAAVIIFLPVIVIYKIYERRRNEN